MKKLFSLAAIFISLCLLSAKKQTPDDPVNIKIAGLFSLTGNWSSLGITSQEAMNLAIKDINNRMEQTGSRYRFTPVIYDTKLDTTVARTAIREAFSKNIRFIVGPQSSAEVEAIRTYANTNGILVISQGSTAGSLAISGDAIYRFCPGEAAEADAMAQAIYGSGRRALITLSRDDIGNMGLQKAVGTAFLNRGGKVDALPPFSITYPTTDFTALLATLKSRIQQKSSELGAGKVAVYLASFDGVKDLFRQAAADPVFRSVHWYGGDAIALNSALLADATASSFATGAQFFAPSFGLPQQAHPDLAAVAAAIKTKTGIEADAYALAIYDALWVIARTVTAFPEPTNDFTKIKEVFHKEANQYFGITGPTYLNAAGDRGLSNFDYWGIINEGGTYSWKWVGRNM